MRCVIANLNTEIPAEGGMASLCRDYLGECSGEANIVIDASRYDPARWPGLSEKFIPYMDSGAQFYSRLLEFGGLMLHGSCIVIDGGAYIFSANSGYGKSTHAGLLEKYIGGEIINDDKPALRLIDGVWTAFGTPWAGKTHRNVNTSAPLKAVCFLSRERGRNSIRRLDPEEAVPRLLDGTVNRLTKEHMLQLLEILDSLSASVPFFELESLANEESARLAWSAMHNADSRKED